MQQRTPGPSKATSFALVPQSLLFRHSGMPKPVNILIVCFHITNVCVSFPGKAKEGLGSEEGQAEGRNCKIPS